MNTEVKSGKRGQTSRANQKTRDRRTVRLEGVWKSNESIFSIDPSTGVPVRPTRTRGRERRHSSSALTQHHCMTMATLPPPPPPPMGMPRLPPRPTSLPPSNVVLLTGIPNHLQPCLANWILPCGPARTILWYPKAQLDETALDKGKSSMALVTMMHGDGAWKLVHTIGALKGVSDLKAHMVPASPDIPLPPIVLDDLVAKPLQEQMLASFENFKNGNIEKHKEQEPPVALLLDTQKVAAAAGGHNYDEDADPLNAPAVLQAVKDFRTSLQKTSTVQHSRRMALVQERLEKAVHALQNPAPPPLPTTTGVPPLTTGLPPPPPLPPPPQPTPTTTETDSGKRGQSNLPAWMTTAQQQQPPAKKAKRAIDPILLRDYVAKQIMHYMGVEEATLIDFCVKHVLEEKPLEGLTQELQPVLEEDTGAFVSALQTKMKELAGGE